MKTRGSTVYSRKATTYQFVTKVLLLGVKLIFSAFSPSPQGRSASRAKMLAASLKTATGCYHEGSGRRPSFQRSAAPLMRYTEAFRHRRARRIRPTTSHSSSVNSEYDDEVVFHHPPDFGVAQAGSRGASWTHPEWLHMQPLKKV
jgi:hypothetical protein